MKRIIALAVVVVFASCGGKKEAVKQEEFVPNDNKPQVAADEQITQGEALVKASDCKTCHHATNKLVGPSHTEVAKKYEFTEANVKMLGEKIQKGGQGNWGSIPMLAHVDLTTDDAQKMARYVLSLDGETEH